MIRGLHHAQITIPKGTEAEGKHFYCEILGLEEIEKPEALKGRGGFWLHVGGKEVHVGTEADVDRRATKAHLAYQVEDISHWRKHLEDYGLEILDSVPIPGYERFEFRDPFGNRVEIIQYSPAIDIENEDFFKQAIKGLCRQNGIHAGKPRFEHIGHLVVISMKNHAKEGLDQDCFTILNSIYQLMGPFGIKFSQQLFLYPDSKRIARVTITFTREDYDELNRRIIHGGEN